MKDKPNKTQWKEGDIVYYRWKDKGPRRLLILAVNKNGVCACVNPARILSGDRIKSSTLVYAIPNKELYCKEEFQNLLTSKQDQEIENLKQQIKSIRANKKRALAK